MTALDNDCLYRRTGKRMKEIISADISTEKRYLLYLTRREESKNLEFMVEWDYFLKKFVGVLVKRKTRELPKRAYYVLHVKELTEKEENFIRRRMRTEFGIDTISGLNSEKAVALPKLIAAE